jgi:hypothetical protein
MPADARACAQARSVFERALGSLAGATGGYPVTPRPGLVALCTWLDAAIISAERAAAEARTASPQDQHAIGGALDLLRSIGVVVRSRT